MQQNMDGLPKLLIVIGTLLMISGMLLWVLRDKIGFSWFGSLPGDIKIERGNFRFYAPLATMLLLSLLFSLIMKVIQRFW